ncbi:MAG TPA: hypothetical protein VFX92_14220, partial [Candidatus Krumholzibacteria bacterium]|nr:hypothetical protein [Candidatus Krumholzibacteria bacterium]
MLLVVTAALLAFASTAGAQPVLTDALYRAHHPRLLFTGDEIPALRAKVTDGGHDDDAYRFIRGLVRDDWANRPIVDVLGAWYADGAIMEIGLVSRIESPEDQNAMALGKAVTLYIANTWEPDFDEAHSGMRLRTLALGYDMFFADASEAERTFVRDEMVRYVQKMIWNPAYKVFEMQPYLANHSAMFAAALGLAAICLQGEAEAYISADALAMADRIVERLLQWQFDAGSYREGDLYALWTLKNVIVYFEARKRFDGFDYSRDTRLRAVEQWLAYELLPEGHARSNNVNDSMISETPYARSSAYFDWAMH